MWKEEEQHLVRRFKFKDFKEAFVFMTEVAFLAEKLDHHPWWSNTYNEVTIKLTTHSAGHVVTQKDRDLAERIDEIWARRERTNH